jgi:hypothetical protein
LVSSVKPTRSYRLDKTPDGSAVRFMIVDGETWSISN